MTLSKDDLIEIGRLLERQEQRLKKVFATKEDLGTLEKRLDGKLAALRESIGLDRRKELAALRKAINKDHADLLVDNVLPLIDKLSGKVEGHERRITRLEDHVGIGQS